jgi:hypothetical protein
MYRRSSIPAPMRTEVTVDDLRHLEVVQRILMLLNEPAASAAALARLVDEMPVLAARLGARFAARVGSRPSTALSELTYLGNRDFEAVLFQLLEDLTDLRAEQAGVPAHGSMLPPLATLGPPPRDGHADGEDVVVPRDAPAGAPDTRRDPPAGR